MRIVIAGGHGKIALLLARQLRDAGHEPAGLIRNGAHADDLRDVGAEPIVLDLESASVEAAAGVLSGADAAVFAAGAGPDSGAARKLTVDRDGAILLADAAVQAGVRRFIVISAISADTYDPQSEDVFQVYLRAKSEADEAVRSRDLHWTIVRPGGLLDTAAGDGVTVGATVAPGTIPRADVAAVVAELLINGLGVGRQFEVVSGQTPVRTALESL